MPLRGKATSVPAHSYDPFPQHAQERPRTAAKGARVYTDWLLVRRLAWEIERRFRGAKVRDVGMLGDGRVALALWSRGKTELLCIDAFAPTPAITVERGDLPVAVEPGFIRTAGAALRGTTLTGAQGRRGDRILRVQFGVRSRFGVVDEYALICELVPRFGNVVLVKGETVVAAMKEFAPSENAVRAVQAGSPYQPPPQRPGQITPLLPDELAAPLVEHAPDGELCVYRRDGTLIAAHLVPMPKYADLQVSRSDSLLDLFAEARAERVRTSQSDTLNKRRAAMARMLDDRQRKVSAELKQVEARVTQARQRERIREEGEAIYASLYELPEAERAEAKERAAALFAKYRKAGSAVEHLERRRADLTQTLDDLTQLRWALDAADDADLDDVAEAIGTPHGRSQAQPRTSRKRKPLQYATANGSRILVGRTPLENAELTFRFARPNDLWFHVQNQPGAHVILQRDDREEPPHADVLAAAALAALHSKAKTSRRVTVDYTQRKHVRKRPSAAPGLVFYTNPKSVSVSPDLPAGLQ